MKESQRYGETETQRQGQRQTEERRSTDSSFLFSSLDGILELLNSKDMTEAGPLQLIDDDDEKAPTRAEALPGVNKDSVKKMPVIR